MDHAWVPSHLATLVTGEDLELDMKSETLAIHLGLELT